MNSYIYIMTNKYNRVLYTGVTSNLKKRVYKHRNDLSPGFAQKYKTKKLVYYEVFEDIKTAISREKQVKGWLRKKKIDLIISFNPDWIDLYEDL